MSNEIQFILYNLPEEDGKVQVIIRDETLWCTQKLWLNFLVWIEQLFLSISKIYSSHLSYSRTQYVQILHILENIVLYRLLYGLWQRI